LTTSIVILTEEH